MRKTYTQKETIYEIIGNKSKIKILDALLSGPLSVNKIVNATNMEQTNVSHTLKYLRTVNVVNRRVIGRNHEYFVSEEIRPFLKKIFSDIKKNEDLLKKAGLIAAMVILTLKFVPNGDITNLITTSYQFIVQNNTTMSISSILAL